MIHDRVIQHVQFLKLIFKNMITYKHAKLKEH